MKYTHTLLVILLLFATSISWAQTVQVDTSKLTPEQQQLLLQMQKQQSGPMVDISQISGVGKELGAAFKECWSAVSTDVERFANSPAGMWAAFLVTWKVMGDDLTNIFGSIARGVAAFVVWIVGTIVFFFTIRRLTTGRTFRIQSSTSDGKVHFDEKYVAPMAQDSWGELTLFGGIGYLLFIGVCSLVAFG